MKKPRANKKRKKENRNITDAELLYLVNSGYNKEDSIKFDDEIVNEYVKLVSILDSLPPIKNADIVNSIEQVLRQLESFFILRSTEIETNRIMMKLGLRNGFYTDSIVSIDIMMKKLMNEILKLIDKKVSFRAEEAFIKHVMKKYPEGLDMFESVSTTQREMNQFLRS